MLKTTDKLFIKHSSQNRTLFGGLIYLMEWKQKFCLYITYVWDTVLWHIMNILEFNPFCLEIFCKPPVILNGQAVLPKATYKANERVQYRGMMWFSTKIWTFGYYVMRLYILFKICILVSFRLQNSSRGREKDTSTGVGKVQVLIQSLLTPEGRKGSLLREVLVGVLFPH